MVQDEAFGMQNLENNLEKKWEAVVKSGLENKDAKRVKKKYVVFS